jgi:hypothetical protein
VALERPEQGTVEKTTLTGIVALPAPGVAATAKSLVLSCRWWLDAAEMAVSEPAIEAPGAALS